MGTKYPPIKDKKPGEDQPFPKDVSNERTPQDSNLQSILNKLGEIEKQLTSCFTYLRQSMRPVPMDSECEKSIKELWNNNHGLNDIFNSIAEIKKSLTTVKGGNVAQEQIANLLNELKNQISYLKVKPELTQWQNDQILQVGEIIRKLLQPINDKLSQLEEAIKQIPKKIGNGSSNVGENDKLSQLNVAIEQISKKIGNGRSNVAESKMKTEHKTYFTWTAVFVIALVLSAIFITRGFLVDFTAPAYLTSVLIIFCISFLVTCVFNLVFSIENINICAEDVARLAYFIVCGILVGGTLGLSIMVLII